MNLQLEEEQDTLISQLVEAERNVTRGKQAAFNIIYMEDKVNALIHHPGLTSGRIEAFPGDIDILARENFIAVSKNEYGGTFDITPQGAAYYKQMKHHNNQPLQRMEASLHKYLESNHFQQKYAKAYQKWKDAESMLWDSDSERQLTTIGHLCREAIQEFATALIEYYQPANVDTDKAHDINRINAVIDSQSDKFGEREKAVITALISYWRAVSGLIQRQEHGNQKQGQSLVWEDGRRVIFQTAIVMYEVDSSLSKAH